MRLPFMTTVAVLAISAAAVETVPLWPEGKVPDAQAHQTSAPYLEWYQRPESPNGQCALLISGGGYAELADLQTVNSFATYLTARGIQCVSLHYRTPRPTNAPIYRSGWQDGQRAVRLVRREAAARGFDPEKIGALGFSAGSHLAVMLATSALTPAYGRIDEIDDTPCHIAWAVPIFTAYALSDGLDRANAAKGDGEGISLSDAFRFDAKTCPMCLVHGSDDVYSAIGSVEIYRRLHALGVSSDLHIYADRGHGFMSDNALLRVLDRWIDRVGDFLDSRPGEAGTIETDHWQRKIDAASAAGGGIVTVPRGRHLVGQIELKSNVELHLDEGAVLEGLAEMRHYRPVELPHSEGLWSAVVFACGVTNVAVTGPGEIFGNGGFWATPRHGNGNQEGLRPRGLFFGDSKDIRLADFRLRDAACWGVVLKCCDRVDIRRLTIDNQANMNNDGIDVEASNVFIGGCDINSGDDGIVLKSNDPKFAVTNVLVTNCTVRSYCNALKLGTASHGIMRDILFTDCRTELPRRDFINRNTGLWYYLNPKRQARFEGADRVRGSSAICVTGVDGGLLENITYRNISVSGVQVPIFIRGGSRRNRDCGTPPSDWYVVRNVLVENVTGEAGSWIPSIIAGVEKCRPSDITLRNVDLVVRGCGSAEVPAVIPENEGDYPDPDVFHCLLPAYGLYIRHADGVKLENCRFRLREGDRDHREQIHEER